MFRNLRNTQSKSIALQNVVVFDRDTKIDQPLTNPVLSE